MIEKFLKTSVLYRGRAVGFRCDEILLPDGKKAVREYLDHPGAVAVIPFLDSPFKVPLEKARVVMVKQYRYAVGEVTEELPAGKLDGKENLQACLRRELKEETGYTARRFKKILSYWPTPAFANEVIHIFWADGLKKGRMSPDEDEFLSRSVDTFGNLMRKVKAGKIRDSKTMLGLLACAQFLWGTPHLIRLPVRPIPRVCRKIILSFPRTRSEICASKFSEAKRESMQ